MNTSSASKSSRSARILDRANPSCSGRRRDRRGNLQNRQILTETRKWRANKRKPERIVPPNNMNTSFASKSSRSARILDRANPSCSGRRRVRRGNLQNRQILPDTQAGNTKWQNNFIPVLLICIVIAFLSRRASLRTQHAATCAYRRRRRRRRQQQQQQQQQRHTF
jgi:hypothetical protein